MEDTVFKDKTSEEQREHIPYSVGRQYIMDWRSPDRTENAPEPEPQSTEEIPEDKPAEITPETEHSPVIADSGARSRTERGDNRRLFFCLIAGLIGIIAGAVIAFAFPVSGADLSLSVAAGSQGDFMQLLLRRLAQSGSFLLAEYILGYFAAGGWLIWLAPTIYGLGAGLSSAGAFICGVNQWTVLPCLIYTVLISFAANGSWEFSALLMRLISGKGEVYASGGSSSYLYTLRFGGYLVILLVVSLAEAGIKIAAA